MKHGENVDDSRTHQIDNPIRADQHFAKIRSLELGNDPARFGEVLKAISGSEKTFDVESGVSLGAASDVSADRLEILDGPQGPDNSGHGVWNNRRRASSWERTWPCSTCFRPASMSAKKYRRSIASSTEVSEGSF